MSRAFKRLFTMGLAWMLVFLAACSGNSGDSGGGGASQTANGGGTTQSAGSGGGNSGGGNSGSEEPVEITIMANFSPADISEADQALISKVEEAVNVKINFIVPPSSGYQEQLQLTLVSGDYPDVVFFPSETSEIFLNAVNDGFLIPVNEYLENAPNLMEYTYDISWEALQVLRDGKIYGIPRTTIARYDGFEVRKDWLDAIGFEVPENHEITIDQFTDILRKFTRDDPDGNGLDDTYGYGGYLNTNKVLDPILSTPLGNLGWQETSGGEYKYMHPMYDRNSGLFKEILAYNQMLFTEGLVDPDALTIDRNMSGDRFKRGITGVRDEFAGYIVGKEKEMKETNPNAELTYLYVQDRNGEVKGAAYGTALWGLWGITNTAEHPEKIVQLFDWLLSDEGWDLVTYGVEGVEYNMVDGKREYIEGMSAPWRKGFVRRAGDANFFLSPTLTQEEIDRVQPFIDKSVESVFFSLDRGYVPPASREPVFMDFKLTWDETLTKIMVGELPVDAFDNLLDEWYEKGGKEYVEQMNEYIESTMQE